VATTLKNTTKMTYIFGVHVADKLWFLEKDLMVLSLAALVTQRRAEKPSPLMRQGCKLNDANSENTIERLDAKQKENARRKVLI